MLYALGRAPNTASLGLEKAGVATENGRIVTDDGMRTSAGHIYAAGDCTGPHEIVHLAVLQGEIAAQNIAAPRKPRRMDYRLLTSIVFTEPQIAYVGLTEKEAQARKMPYLAASYPFADHGKSLIMEAKDGFVKLLANPASGEIIGGACAGPVGGELIHEIVAAMHKRMTVRELAAMPHYHPTLAEIWTYPAEELMEKIEAVPGINNSELFAGAWRGAEARQQSGQTKAERDDHCGGEVVSSRRPNQRRNSEADGGIALRCDFAEFMLQPPPGARGQKTNRRAGPGRNQAASTNFQSGAGTGCRR